MNSKLFPDADKDSIAGLMNGMKELADNFTEAQQERINRYVDQTPRPLSNGRLKCTLTGLQHDVDERREDFAKDLPRDNMS